MKYYNITKVYNNSVALLELKGDKVSNSPDINTSILIDLLLLDVFNRHYAYKCMITNINCLDAINNISFSDINSVFPNTNKKIEFITTPNVKRLYHVSIKYDTEPKIKLFKPTVPISSPVTEDKISRVCFSDNIEHCLSSISYGLNKMLCEELPNMIIRVYSIDIPLDLGWVILPTDVHYKHNVKDALLTQEYWYLGNIFMDSKLYRVIDFKSDYCYNVNKYDEDNFFNFYLKHKIKNKSLYTSTVNEITKHNLFDLINYSCDNVLGLNRLKGITNFSMDLENMFSFNIKDMILDFSKYNEFYTIEFLIDDTLVLKELVNSI